MRGGAEEEARAKSRLFTTQKWICSHYKIGQTRYVIKKKSFVSKKSDLASFAGCKFFNRCCIRVFALSYVRESDGGRVFDLNGWGVVR